MIGFSFAAYWLREWREFFKPITERSEAKPMQSRITFHTQLQKDPSTAYHLSSFHSFYDSLRRRNYVTPTSYLELIMTFKKLLDIKRQEIMTLKQRYVTGLEKLDFASSQVSVMQQELSDLQPELIKTSAETEKLMIKIEQDTVEVEAKKEVRPRWVSFKRSDFRESLTEIFLNCHIFLSYLLSGNNISFLFVVVFLSFIV